MKNKDKTKDELLEELAEKKLSEEALRESEKRYRTLFEKNPYGIQEIDAVGTIIYANKAHHDMYGYEEGGLLGLSITDFLVPGLQRDELPSYLSILVKEQPPPIMYHQKILIKSGKERDIEVAWNYLRDSKGHVKGFISVLTDITERKKAEYELHQYKHIVSSSTDMLALLDKRYTYLATNKSYRDAFNMTPDQLIGSTVSQVFGEEFFKTVIKPNADRCLSGEEIHYEDWFVFPNTGKKYMSINYYSYLNNENEIVGFVVNARDITDRKKAEGALEDSENKYRMLLNNIPQKIFYKDINSVYMLCNESYAKDLNIKPTAIIGKTDFDFYTKELAEKYRIDDKDIMSSGKVREIEENYVADGKKMTVHTLKAPIFDETGKTVGLFGVFWDITERKNAVEELRESEQKYKDLQDASIDGHAWTDMAGHLIEVNDSYINMMGYSEDELRNLTYKDITPEKWHASEQIILTEQILARGYSDPYEKELIRKDGTIFPVELRAYLIKDAQGNNTGMRAVVRNITERKKAEEQLIKAHDELELHVKDRTLELQEKNIALKVLLKQQEEVKNDLEQNILSNIKSLIQPYIAKLKRNNSNSEDVAYLNIIESNLEDIISPFSQKLSSNYMMFTSREIEIANFIREGKKDKEIMEIMNIAFDTVKAHRKNIRKKLGITGKGTNLRNKLLSM